MAVKQTNKKYRHLHNQVKDDKAMNRNITEKPTASFATEQDKSGVIKSYSRFKAINGLGYMWVW